MQSHTVVLEAQFTQWAMTLQSGASASPAAVDAMSRHARKALRGFNALARSLHASASSEPHETAPRAATVLPHDIERLSRSAARLAHALAQHQAKEGRAVDGTALAHHVRALGIEMNHPLDPVAMGEALRRVLDGSAQLRTSTSTAASLPAATATEASTLARLFSQIAFVVALTRHQMP